MDELRSHNLDFIVDTVPCKFTKRGAIHKSVFKLLQQMQEAGGISEQVHHWDAGAGWQAGALC